MFPVIEFELAYNIIMFRIILLLVTLKCKFKNFSIIGIICICCMYGKVDVLHQFGDVT